MRGKFYVDLASKCSRCGKSARGQKILGWPKLYPNEVTVGCECGHEYHARRSAVEAKKPRAKRESAHKNRRRPEGLRRPY